MATSSRVRELLENPIIKSLTREEKAELGGHLVARSLSEAFDEIKRGLPALFDDDDKSD